MSPFLLLFGQQASPQEAISWAHWLASWWAWCQTPGARLLIGCGLSAIGIWGMLPSRRVRTRRIAGLVAAVGAGLVISLAPTLGGTANTVLFWLVSGIAIVSAAATITARSPVYSAIWFAQTLAATAGLFLLNGAQFLGVATVAVYAGAIVVTFLFVLMLSQPDGHDFYDRISWGNIPALFASLAGAAMLGLVGWLTCGPGDFAVVSQAAEADVDVLTPDHVAALGTHLFTQHLIAVQAAAVLMMAALVGAVAISMRGKQMLVGSYQSVAVDRGEPDRAHLGSVSGGTP